MPTDNDQPHHHRVTGYFDDNGSYDVILPDFPCVNDDTCPDNSPVVVVALDDYRQLVAAARDRHPTNQQRRPDPTSRPPNYGHGDDCLVCYPPNP